MGRQQPVAALPRIQSLHAERSEETPLDHLQSGPHVFRVAQLRRLQNMAGITQFTCLKLLVK